MSAVRKNRKKTPASTAKNKGEKQEKRTSLPAVPDTAPVSTKTQPKAANKTKSQRPATPGKVIKAENSTVHPASAVIERPPVR